VAQPLGKALAAHAKGETTSHDKAIQRAFQANWDATAEAFELVTAAQAALVAANKAFIACRQTSDQRPPSLDWCPCGEHGPIYAQSWLDRDAARAAHAAAVERFKAGVTIDQLRAEVAR
jgi:hypothetical protein